ncbi:MAG TPA: ATP-binding cassette domain-containing protein [Candidatus Babeliales bacterium]|nr:ATP-binding cassette domain-containing protein [Candidatus Babeliales bacterium]
MLVIKNVTKTFGNKTILNHVSFDVQPGEIAVLLGSSGVGKSTLLRILNNLETKDAGEILLDGQPLQTTANAQQHTVGMVFQQFNLFEHLTVEQNITLALEKVDKKTAQEAHTIALQLLTHYGLADKANQPVTRLSGGQKQRLAIARALALKPKIICFDEPTSALDPLLTTHVANSIKELAEQKFMVIVATHDTTLLEKLPCTIYLMSNGSIIESAPSQDFFAHKNKFIRINNFVAGNS